MNSPKFLPLLALCAIFFSAPSRAVEVFAKGSASKNFISQNNYTLSISASTGFAVTLVSQIRVEARYTNVSSLQNSLDVRSASLVGTLSDILTQTAIYSVGVDIDVVSDKNTVQPFIYIGCGYIESMRSSYFTLAGASTSTYYQEPKQQGFTGNLGLGFRIRIARALAIELEVFSYGTNIDKPNPLINMHGTAGIRLFI